MKSIAFKILNMDALNAIEEENEHIEDVREKEARRHLLDAIWDKMADYDAHMFKYEYKQHVRALIERGIEFVPVDKNVIAAQWDELFALSVSEKAKRETTQYNEQYKWHLFSFNLLESLKADDARGAFDAQTKNSIYIFFQHAEEAYLVKNAHLLKAEDLGMNYSMERSDVYVFDQTEKWTYVKTHEMMCGPYFYQIK